LCWRRPDRRLLAERGHDGRQPPELRHDPHAHETAVGGVLELRLGHLVDVVRALGRGYLDEQRVDVLVGERLTAHFPRLPRLHHRHGLIGEEIQLIAPLSKQDVDERVETRRH
jgi:hypothetical protein